MKIDVTKKEYQLLLDMLHLSDWMMHSHEINDKNNDYKELRKKLLSHYKEMEATDRIEYSSQYDQYYELEPYDEILHEKFIAPFEDDFF